MANITMNKPCRVCGANPADYYPSKVKVKDYICVTCCKTETAKYRLKKLEGIQSVSGTGVGMWVTLNHLLSDKRYAPEGVVDLFPLTRSVLPVWRAEGEKVDALFNKIEDMVTFKIWEEAEKAHIQYLQDVFWEDTKAFNSKENCRRCQPYWILKVLDNNPPVAINCK